MRVFALKFFDDFLLGLDNEDQADSEENVRPPCYANLNFEILKETYGGKVHYIIKYVFHKIIEYIFKRIESERFDLAFSNTKIYTFSSRI